MPLGSAHSLDDHSRRRREAGIVAVFHVVCSRTWGSGCRESELTLVLTTGTNPMRPKPHSTLRQTKPLFLGLLTGAGPGDKRWGATHGEGRRTCALHTEPRKDVIGVRAGSLLARGL